MFKESKVSNQNSVTRCKILLWGASDAGKTSLLHKHIKNEFPCPENQTEEPVNFNLKTIETEDFGSVRSIYWDCRSDALLNETYSGIYLKDTNALILVFDAIESLEDLKVNLDVSMQRLCEIEIQESCMQKDRQVLNESLWIEKNRDLPLLIALNKSDDITDSEDKLSALVSQSQAIFSSVHGVCCNAETDVYVERLFTMAASLGAQRVQALESEQNIENTEASRLVSPR